MTNLDRIRGMTLEELAPLLASKACECCAYLSFAPCGFGTPACEEGIKKWLEQEPDGNYNWLRGEVGPRERIDD